MYPFKYLRYLIGHFLVNDMQYLHPSKRTDFFCQKSLRNLLKQMKNPFSDFLVFEIWSFKILKIVWIFFFVLKDAQCSETDFAHLTILRFWLFEIWSILYKTFVIKWGRRRIQKFTPRNPPFVGASPPSPGCFWIESPKPTGYWVSLASHSESGSPKSLEVTNSLRMFSTKWTIFWKN